jgi:hypothetical protein
MLLIARNLLRAEGEMFLKTLGCIKVSAVAGIIFTWARATKQRSVISDQHSAHAIPHALARLPVALHKKKISPRMNTDGTDLQIQKGPI